MLQRSVKPYYPKGDHCLWSDIISDLTPFQALGRIMQYEYITLGLESNLMGITLGTNQVAIWQIRAFVDKCVKHWEFKQKVADMFTRPGLTLQ